MGPLLGAVAGKRPTGSQRDGAYASGREFVEREYLAKLSKDGFRDGRDIADLLQKERPEIRLVGFKVDGRGRLIGEAWVPTAGLGADEWATYVQAVARSYDRVEYLLTGRDEE